MRELYGPSGFVLLSCSYLVGHCVATARATDTLLTAEQSGCAAKPLAMQPILVEKTKAHTLFKGLWCH